MIAQKQIAMNTLKRMVRMAAEWPQIDDDTLEYIADTLLNDLAVASVEDSLQSISHAARARLEAGAEHFPY